MDRLTQDGSMHEFGGQASSSRERHRQASGGDMELPDREHQEISQERLAWLVRTIEIEIIPRLMLAHQTGSSESAAVEDALVGLGPDAVARFAEMVLGSDSDRPARHVEALRRQGVPLDMLYLELLSPTARRLGQMWEEDLCDFTAVTLGLWRLQQVIYDLSPAFQSEAEYEVKARRAMLVPAPGSQHTMGLLMVGEFFRRAGWDVWGEPSATADEWLNVIRHEWFDVIGFSVGSELHIPGLASVVLALRKASRNPAVGVLVGGPLLGLHPEYVTLVGADATAVDAPGAVAQAEQLWNQRSRRC